MRVLVTRPQEQAVRTAERLIALGHEPLVAPLLRVDRTDGPAPPGPFDALVLTSANAVAPLESTPIARDVPTFAVGARTADRARAAGFSDVREAEGHAASLADLVDRSLAPRARLLHVAGRDRRAEPQASLLAAGFKVETWVAYEAVPAEALPERLLAALRDDAVDAALHYSPRSAEVLLGLGDRAGVLPALLELWHACLSPDVAAPLRQREAARLIVAARPDEASLLAALDVCQRSRRCGPRPLAAAAARTHETSRDPVR